MKVLGIETSTYAGGVAIIEDEKILGETFLNIGPSHSENLLPGVTWLLGEIGLEKDEIDGVSVSAGPGSFTALRIGMSTGKGIAFSLGIPITAVSSLETLTMNLICVPYLVCPVIDAKRGEVYSAFYRYRGSGMEIYSDEFVVTPRELAEKVDENTLFIGGGALIYKDYLKSELGELSEFCPYNLNFPRASNCALLGLRKLRNGEGDSVETLEPRYMRNADAQIQT